MPLAVREMDVCLHLPTRRRCLVVWVGDNSARCVYDDDQYFDCPTTDLMPYRHPRFSEAVRIARDAAHHPPAG